MKKFNIIFAIFIYLIFSLSSVFMKLASSSEDLIMKSIFFCLSIGTLGIFSILWQLLLKNIDLMKAYIFKSTTIIWSLIYGIIIFKESISINMIIGIIITMVGMIIIIRGGNVIEIE